MEVIQPVDTKEFLDVAIEIAHRWESHLGRKRKGKAEKAFEALREGKFELGHPQAYTFHIAPEDFEERGLTLSSKVEAMIADESGYSFYVIPVPVLLFPGRGASYRLLESQISFDVKGKQRRVAIYSIFPEPLWRPVLEWGGDFCLALDGNLRWGIETGEFRIDLEKFKGQLAGKVGNINQLSGFIKVVPFKYNLGRMEIESQFSSGIAMWRLDSKEAIRSQTHMRFVILLKVPSEVDQIRIEAKAQAEVAYDWLTAQLTDVFERLPEKLKQIISMKKGLPLQDFQNWTLDLRQVSSVNVNLASQ